MPSVGGKKGIGIPITPLFYSSHRVIFLYDAIGRLDIRVQWCISFDNNAIITQLKVLNICLGGSRLWKHPNAAMSHDMGSP